MSKIEEYIKKYTRRCINLDSKNYKPIPWLTPYHAEQVAQIAREELVEKACKWLRKNAHKYYFNKEQYLGTDELVEDFELMFGQNKALEDKV